MDDLFNHNSDNDKISIPEDVNYLEEYVGDGKKFKTVDELAKGKAYSDAYISKLEEKVTLLSQKAAKVETEEDFYNRIKSMIEKPPVNPPSNPPNSRADEENDNKGAKAGLTLEDVEKLLAEREAKRSQETVLQTSQRKLVEALGDADKAKELIAIKSQELGLSVDEIKAMGSKNTKAFLSLLGVNESNPSKHVHNPINPPPSIRLNVGTGDTKVGLTLKDFHDMRRKNPAKFYSSEVQRQYSAELNKAIAEGRAEEFLS